MRPEDTAMAGGDDERMTAPPDELSRERLLWMKENCCKGGEHEIAIDMALRYLEVRKDADVNAAESTVIELRPNPSAAPQEKP
jgi:hypothetical protein